MSRPPAGRKRHLVEYERSSEIIIDKSDGVPRFGPTCLTITVH